MHNLATIPIGTCTYGPVVLSQSVREEDKFSISVIEYVSLNHVNLITCKTTSQKRDKLWDGEFILDDLFGNGPTKVQPFNIIRIRKPRLVAHRKIGHIDPTILPKFQRGLMVGIKMKVFDAKEQLDLANSWQKLFLI